MARNPREMTEFCALCAEFCEFCALDSPDNWYIGLGDISYILVSFGGWSETGTQTKFANTPSWCSCWRACWTDHFLCWAFYMKTFPWKVTPIEKVIFGHLAKTANLRCCNFFKRFHEKRPNTKKWSVQRALQHEHQHGGICELFCVPVSLHPPPQKKNTRM